MAVDYSQLTEEQIEIINEYCENDMKKLKSLCYLVWGNKGLPSCYHDDLYDDAMNVLVESVISYNPNNNTKFKTYLMNNINLSHREWYRNTHLRAKRNNLELDKDGKIKKDENGNPLIIKNISIDAPVWDEDDSTLRDIICDETDSNSYCDEQIVIEYLNTLTSTQKKIVELKLQGLNDNEIKVKLRLSDKKYDKCYSQLKSIDNRLKIKEMFREERVINKEEDKPMITTQTAEKSKPMQYSISSINKKIENRTIRFDHPLQRESDQWSPSMKGNLVSDILQGNPLPEIVFAEQIVNGMPVVWDLDGKQRCTNCYSYANDGFKVSRNIRRWEITYIAQIKDENGKPVLDENGFPTSEYRTFDIRNKKFSQLPKELQEKFLDYTFKCDQYLNCDSEEIAYHIIRYNEGKSMTKAQKGITRIGEEFAMMVKSISAMPFFREIGGYKLSEAKNGTLERVVVESVMASKYLDDWKKEQEYICEYLKDNATTEDFDNFEDLVTRLESVVTEDVADMFDSKDSFLWFGLFTRFVNSGENDEKFIEFMAEFAQSLHSKKVNGISFDSLCINANGNTRGTKDKNMVVDKMELLENLMNEFLCIDKEDIKEVDYKEFLKINVEDIIDEDVVDIQMSANDISEELDENSWMLSEQNYPAYLAIVGLAFRKDVEDRLKEWLPLYVANNQFIRNQQKAFLHMKESFGMFIQKGAMA